MPSTLASRLTRFYTTLQPPHQLPMGIDILYPQQDKRVKQAMKTFFHKYFDDNNRRRLLFGINPGRFGGGITGINFTAPRQLKINCGIDHPFGDSSELSAEFIYDMIEEYGGAARFYKDHFIAAVSPLGFVKKGINMNYYDDKQLQSQITPFIVFNIKKLLTCGFKTDRCVCIGGEKNFKFLASLNKEHKFFEELVPLAHPRFILQYRRKQKEAFIRQYLDVLRHE